MESGIILAINNIEKEINKSFFEAFIECYKNIKICLVNNGSTDGTENLLAEVQRRFPNNIFVLNIKNMKSNDSALKAGFRFLLSKKELSQITISNRIEDLEKLKFGSELATTLNN
jgi:glycosyltransferase involved in cell wall biosynthesis